MGFFHKIQINWEIFLAFLEILTFMSNCYLILNATNILHTYHENFAGLKKVNDGRDTKFGYAYYLLIMPFKTRLIICTKEV